MVFRIRLNPSVQVTAMMDFLPSNSLHPSSPKLATLGLTSAKNWKSHLRHLTAVRLTCRLVRVWLVWSCRSSRQLSLFALWSTRSGSDAVSVPQETTDLHLVTETPLWSWEGMYLKSASSCRNSNKMNRTSTRNCLPNKTPPPWEQQIVTWISVNLQHHLLQPTQPDLELSCERSGQWKSIENDLNLAPFKA